MPKLSEFEPIDFDSGHIAQLRWSHDGHFLAVPTEHGLTAIFDVETEQVTQRLEGHSEVTAVGWDPQSELIMTSSADRSIDLWELTSGRKKPFSIDDHRQALHSLEWTDEGAYLITCSADRIVALDGCCLLRGWSKQMEDQVNKDTRFTVATCSRHSTFLLAIAAEDGGVLLLVNLLSADLIDRIEMNPPARSIAWSGAEDLLAVGSGNGIVTLRATHEGFRGPPCAFPDRIPDVHALAFSEDGRLLASRDGQGLKVWDVSGTRLMARLDDDTETPSTGHRPPGIAFHPRRPLIASVTTNGTAFRLVDIDKLTRDAAG